MIFAAGAGTAVGMAVGGIVAVLVISAVFYAIGRGEDRDRASAACEPEPDPPLVPPPANPAASEQMGGLGTADRQAPPQSPGQRRPSPPPQASRRRRP